MKGRDLLIYLAIKYRGAWKDIYTAITRREEIKPEDVESALSGIKCSILTILDEEYPESFKTVYHPPFVLFYYGDIHLLFNYKKILAVVGSRDFSDYGKKMTEEIVRGVAPKYIIVSGLARGIDAIAHESCMEVGGKTIAILGSGIDYCYPHNNKDLYEKIKNQHLVLSEYPDNCEPCRDNFPERNRLIAACAKSLLVTEAKAKSGTLITVGYTLELGRDVMCVPHQAGEGSSCNRLISGGALLVENADDVLYALS